MRSIPILAVLALAAGSLLSAPPARAKFPDPNTSTLVIGGQTMPCQFRFRADGGLDHLIVDVTFRDAFGLPVPDCAADITLAANEETLALCSCCPVTRSVASDADGALHVEFDHVGGRGSLDVIVTVLCLAEYELFREAIAFTSPNLTGSCAALGILDLGLWAGGLPPASYCRESDYDCDSVVDVLDLAVWAGGLGVDCGAASCP